MIEEKVKKVLQENVDPILSEHYGGSVLTKIEDDVAYVRLTGSCATCPAAQDTIKDVVRTAILGNVPDLRPGSTGLGARDPDRTGNGEDL